MLSPGQPPAMQRISLCERACSPRFATSRAGSLPPLRRALRPLLIFALLGASALAADPVTDEAWQKHRARSAATLNALDAASPAADDDARAIPLTFERFFEPVGDEGLVFTPQAKALAGRRVRVGGFMVREPSRAPGVFLLVRRRQFAPADSPAATADLPPAVIYVHLPAEAATKPVPFVPGRITVTGVLELGAQPEAGGRNSSIRLRLDAAPDFTPPRRAATNESPTP